jgi:predicted transcriptional regulator
MARRSGVEIIGEILRHKEAGKTQIMYAANLSHAQLERYLAFLQEKGLLQRVDGKARIPLYVTTAKGLALLRHIDTVVTDLGLDELE